MSRPRYPRVSFRIKPSEDLEAFFGFVANMPYDGGRSLEWAVLDVYPTCRAWFKDGAFVGMRTVVSAFIKNRFARDADAMRKNINLYERRWRALEPTFQELVRCLFPAHPWPKGAYTAYPTIWGMFPRSIERKVFQVPYRYRDKRYVSVIIAHEMLHFIFYDYFYKRYPKCRGDKYEMMVWHVSEIFNTVVQNSTPWLAAFGEKTMGYPEHEKIVAMLARKQPRIGGWQTDALINDIIAEVQKMTKRRS